MREQIDFLILAPLQVEISELVKSINKANKVRNKKSQAACYRFTLGKWSIVVLKLEGQGCLQSSIQTMNLLDEFDPKFTVSFGIAGSLQKDVKLGDVVIGSTVYYYEPAKETTRGKSKKGVTSSRHFTYPCHEPLFEHTFPRLKFIVHDKRIIASGEKLIADINSNSRLLIGVIQSKMACVEMEAAGVAAAVKNHCLHYGKFISVKGISDYADKHKNSGKSEENVEKKLGSLEKNGEGIETDDEIKRQRKAAANAATILIKLILGTESQEQTTIQGNPSRITSAIQFAGTFDKWLEKFGSGICPCTIDYDLLKRAAFYTDLPTRSRNYKRKVPIYYHWRQLNKDGLHLVDYLQLILLQKLSKSSSVDPIALITHDGFSLDELVAISSQVKNIIGSDPIYSSQIFQQYTEYTTYCACNGYDGSESQDIDSFYHVGSSEGKYHLLRLLPYVAYNSRHIGACIILCWHEHREIYGIM